VFAYGSLMWRPEIPFLRREKARLFGWHRRLCVYSHHYRGTPDDPGLVLGLDRGGSCTGVAYEVAPRDESAVLAKLDARELVTHVYRRTRLPIVTAAGTVPAWTYVARREHGQYAGVLDEARTLALVEQACGHAGPCREYVVNTVKHLHELGIRDRRLQAVAARLGWRATGDRAATLAVTGADGHIARG
jgi:cation transport protein ChaC